ncbi:MAG: leucine-rich repeat domain-containing protein [Oscillospiraceae bacterium]|nr:leucine-rich repeat domain-containing protein [Oscillospiraceae bacterium]
MSTVHKGYGHHLRTRSINALIIVAVCIVVIILAAFITNLVILPSSKYNNAVDAMESGNYIKAVYDFVELDDYKDSLDNTILCLEKIYEVDLSYATTTAISPWWVITSDGQLSFDQNKYEGDGNIALPSVVDGIVVTAVAEYGFANSYEIISVEIPESVTELHEGAFYYCTALQSVTFPQSLTAVGDSAFFSNMSLKSVELPASLSKLGVGTFENCVNLEVVNIPRRLYTISESAFSGCSSLDTVYYSGSETKWNSIDIASDNEPVLNAEIIFEQ